MLNTYVLSVPNHNSGYNYDEVNRRVDRIVSGQFAQEARYGSNSYQSNYAKAAFYQSLCNNGYSGNCGSSSYSSNQSSGSWCSNGIF